jgi:hypothetical protein
MPVEIDVEGLVAAKLLNLKAVFEKSDWKTVKVINSYTACSYGETDEPGEVEIVLQKATEYGITAYRWAEEDDGGYHEKGAIVLHPDEVREDAMEHVIEQDDEPDIEDLVNKIVDTGYFGSATRKDILNVCECATEHSEGYLILRAGKITYPIESLLTTCGHLDGCDYVTLDADFQRVSYAAHALLRAVKE